LGPLEALKATLFMANDVVWRGWFQAALFFGEWKGV
jgi:hypothetical protein